MSAEPVVTIDQVLGTDFDGNPSTNFSEVVLDGLDDARHLERVPALVEILHGASSPALDRFLSCVALTSWAVDEGFDAVIEACADPGTARWEGVSIDRIYSVDNTFGQLAMAARTSAWLSRGNGNDALRMHTVRALVDASDKVYFDGQLSTVVRNSFDAQVVSSVTTVVRRGLGRLRDGDEPRWDLPTQLVDVTAGVAVKASRTAVDLTVDLVAVSPSPRLLRHAVDVVARAEPADTADLADLLCALGGDAITPLVVAALEQRRRLP